MMSLLRSAVALALLLCLLLPGCGPRRDPGVEEGEPAAVDEATEPARPTAPPGGEDLLRRAENVVSGMRASLAAAARGELPEARPGGREVTSAERDAAIAGADARLEQFRLDLPAAAEHFKLARDMERRRDDALAAAHFLKGLRLDPRALEGYEGLGRALGGAGEHELAVAALRIAVELDPDRPEGHARLGLALHEADMPERAIESLTTAVELDPDLGEAWAGLFVAYWRVGDYAGARDAVRRAADLRAPIRVDILDRLRSESGLRMDLDLSYLDE